jgi:hypothetical protein
VAAPLLEEATTPGEDGQPAGALIDTEGQSG